jgi:hypothetical protein
VSYKSLSLCSSKNLEKRCEKCNSSGPVSDINGTFLRLICILPDAPTKMSAYTIDDWVTEAINEPSRVRIPPDPSGHCVFTERSKVFSHRPQTLCLEYCVNTKWA